MGYVQYLIFKIENRKYAIELAYVNGTEQSYSVSPIPDAPFGIDGLINLRGKLVPVYSLRQRFGMDSVITNPAKSAIIAKTSRITMAYEVDEVEFIEQVNEDDIKEMPHIAGNEETSFMDKVLHIKNEIIVVVDVNKVLSADIIETLERMLEERSEAEKKAEEGRRAAELAEKEKELEEKEE